MWKNKKYKWIIINTSYIYLSKIRIVRYINVNDVNHTSFESSKRRRVQKVFNLGAGMRNKIMELVNLFNNRPARIFIAKSIYGLQNNHTLYIFLNLVNNNKVKFISTDILNTACDVTNQIESNMKYIKKILLRFEKCLLTQKLPKLNVDHFVKRIEDSLNQIKSKRTYDSVHNHLFSLYFQYKLNL